MPRIDTIIVRSRTSIRETDLTRQLTAQISDYIRSQNAPKGTRLVERRFKLESTMRTARL